MEMQLPEDFKEFLKLLDSAEVEYLLIGGFAVGYYGYPRTTNDIDVWVSRTKPNAAKLVATLEEFGVGTPELRPELFQKSDCIVRMGVPPMRVEFLPASQVLNSKSAIKHDCEENLTGSMWTSSP